MYISAAQPTFPPIVQEGTWGGTDDDERSLITARVQPGYVNCRAQGRLPGCLFEFDDIDAQCRSERTGERLTSYVSEIKGHYVVWVIVDIKTSGQIINLERLSSFGGKNVQPLHSTRTCTCTCTCT